MANPTGKGGFQERPETRNKHGQRNKAAVSFSRSLREYIVNHGETKVTLPNGRKIKRIEAVVVAIYNEAIKGNMQAATFIAERVEGKIKDQVEVTGAEGRELFNHNVIAGLLASRPSGDTTT